MEKTAVIIGATGAVGKEILKEILADNFWLFVKFGAWRKIGNEI